MKFNKRIIVINGKGGSGKDTLVRKFANHVNKQYYSDVCMNITAIRPVELLIGEIRNLSDELSAPICKYETEKSDEYRALMHTLKVETDKYCDLSYSYLMNVVTKKWLNDINVKWLFVHIREPENIERFVSAMKAISNYMIIDSYEDGKLRGRADERLFFDVKTMLVVSDMTENHEYGNHADDDVDKYKYDITVRNDEIKEEIIKPDSPISMTIKTGGLESSFHEFYNVVTEGMLLK